MTLDLPPLSLAEIMSAFALIGVAVTFLRKPGDQANAAVADLRKEVTDMLKDAAAKAERLDERVSVIEGEMQHLPNRDMVHKMDLSLSQLQGEVKVLVERIKPIAATSARLEEWLQERAK